MSKIAVDRLGSRRILHTSSNEKYSLDIFGHIKQTVVLAGIAIFAVAVLASYADLPQAFAQTSGSSENDGNNTTDYGSQDEVKSEFKKFSREELENNPQIARVLEQLQKTKERIQEIKEQNQQRSEHQKLIEEQRKIAQEKLQKDLEGMRSSYEDFTPRNSYNKFLQNSVNASKHDIFWDQFEYMDKKVTAAKAVKKQILQNGGTVQEARDAYNRIASTGRVEMVELIQKLNIKYGYADKTTQILFNENGKLPRTGDGDSAQGKILCISCGMKNPDNLLMSKEEFEKYEDQYKINYTNGTTDEAIDHFEKLKASSKVESDTTIQSKNAPATQQFVSFTTKNNSAQNDTSSNNTNQNDSNERQSTRYDASDDPIAVLNMRLAHGEITVEEYHKIKNLITENSSNKATDST